MEISCEQITYFSLLIIQFQLTYSLLQTDLKSSILWRKPSAEELSLILRFVAAANLVIPVYIVRSSDSRPANQEPWSNSQWSRLVFCRGTEKITAEPVQSSSKFHPGRRRSNASTPANGIIVPSCALKSLVFCWNKPKGSCTMDNGGCTRAKK